MYWTVDDTNRMIHVQTVDDTNRLIHVLDCG